MERFGGMLQAAYCGEVDKLFAELCAAVETDPHAAAKFRRGIGRADEAYELAREALKTKP